jgi:hypothetical protein
MPSLKKQHSGTSDSGLSATTDLSNVTHNRAPNSLKALPLSLAIAAASVVIASPFVSPFLSSENAFNAPNAITLAASRSRDMDKDGIPDHRDMDRDGDGIDNHYELQTGYDPDSARSTPKDQDKDGLPDDIDVDRDGDRVNNLIDKFPDNPKEWGDIDKDGIGDNADNEKDGDGFPDAVEIELGTNPYNPNDYPRDTDGDGIPDVLDDDIDNDGYLNENDAFPMDKTEWSDLDGDGIGDNSDPDRDNDGINNDYETQVGTDPNDPNDTPPDMDGDGIPDQIDDDRDGDGCTNATDAFPDDPEFCKDTDADGIPDSKDDDIDGDGIRNELEIQLGTDPTDASSVPKDFDGDGIPDALDDDMDNDGHLNDVDAFPLNEKEWSDLDKDGIGDNSDTDRDGDGISNAFEIKVGTNPDDAKDFPSDLDGDGIPDALDDDRDGDGYLNDVDAFPNDPKEWSDIDKDGIGDNADSDRDGDGISNDYELKVNTDPNDPNSVPGDLDGDGIPDSLDADRDGDGFDNGIDVFPDDQTEWSDLDQDGIGDNKDIDRDGDLFANDVEEMFESDPNDPKSFPDDLKPALELSSTDEVVDINQDSIRIRGQAYDIGVGINAVFATSNLVSGKFEAKFFYHSAFAVEVPLAHGDNVITIHAIDNDNNEFTVKRRIKRPKPAVPDSDESQNPERAVEKSASSVKPAQGK